MAIIHLISSIMDRLEESLESQKSYARIGTLLVTGFLAGILIIELNRQGMLPSLLASHIPVQHLMIIAPIFTIILCFEVISLIFSFVHSVTISIGKQVEVLTLVLLRDVFKEFSHFSEPLVWSQVKPFLFPMISSALGALALFMILGFYYREHHANPITNDEEETNNFIGIKKVIAFILLSSFIAIIFHDLWLLMTNDRPTQTFETFYTVLVFSDILIILVSMRYSSSYHVAFRNSGFAVSTVFIRLALISPPPFNALIGIGSALFATAVSINYTRFKLRYSRKTE